MEIAKNYPIESTFVIVGGGIAGVSCAENLAFLCPKQEITLVTESSLIKTVTNLVPLGKSLTKFDVEECNISSSNLKVKIIIDILCYINTKEKYIRTKGEKIIKYKFLCICTGARPKIIDTKNKFVIGIRDTESVLEFQKRIKNSRKIAIIGNGGIASEIAYAIENLEVDWIIKDDYISSTFVDPGAAQFFQNKLMNKSPIEGTKSLIKRTQYSESSKSEKAQRGAALGPDWHRLIDIKGNIKNLSQNVKIHYQTEIKSLEISNEKLNKFPLKVKLTNGEEIECDFLVSATGVNPEINFESDCNFKVGNDGGIFVNEFMQTNISNIFAAGDVCSAGWNHAEHWFQMRLWTQARQMGSMAGKSMAASFKNEIIHQDFCFEIFGHVTSLFSYPVVLLGKYNGQGFKNNYEVILRITPDKEYIKFVLKNDRLQGAILIGETGLEETCENLILNQLDLTPYGDDILNPDIDIEDYFD